MADNSDNRKAKTLEALEEAHGIVTTACKNAGISRSTFYEWKETDKEFEAAVEEINDTAIDFVESKLFQKINGVQVMKGIDEESGEPIIYDLPPSDTAIIFYLKTKAKKRGYVERQEITGADGHPIGILTLDPLADDATNDSPAENSEA